MDELLKKCEENDQMRDYFEEFTGVEVCFYSSWYFLVHMRNSNLTIGREIIQICGIHLILHQYVIFFDLVNPSIIPIIDCCTIIITHALRKLRTLRVHSRVHTRAPGWGNVTSNNDICGVTFLQHIYIICCWQCPIRNQRTRVPPYNCWDHVSGITSKFVYCLVVNNNKYLSYVFDNIIFGISVPDYRCITVHVCRTIPINIQMSVP